MSMSVLLVHLRLIQHAEVTHEESKDLWLATQAQECGLKAFMHAAICLNGGRIADTGTGIIS